VNPKLKLALASSVFALIAAAYYFFWKRTPALPPYSPKFVAQRRAFSGAPRAALPVDESAAAEVKACLVLWENLRARDLRRPLEAHTLPADGACTKVPDPLKAYHLQFRETCGQLATADDLAFCTLALLDYRVHITQFLTTGTPLSKIDDLLVLSDKLVASDVDDGKEMLAVAERMLEVNPQFYPAAKAALVARFRTVVAEEDGKSWDQTLSALQRAKRFSKKDEELLEVEAAIALIRNRDAKKAEEIATAMDTQFPTSGTGTYYRAWIAAVQGDPGKAKTILQSAQAKQPDNMRVRDTLSIWDENKEMPEAAFGMSLSYDALDI